MGRANGTRAVSSGVGWGWVALWVALVAYAARFAPPEDPALLGRLLRADLASVDASIVAVFNMLGVIPVLASGFVLRDGATRRLPAWPFALGMFALGAFALLPWLALRRLGGARTPPRPAGRVRRMLATRAAAWGVVAALAALATWGLLAGSGTAYLAAFRTTSLVHVMTIDLVLCAGLLFALGREAHGVEAPRAVALLRWIPIFGVAVENAVLRRAAADPRADHG